MLVRTPFLSIILPVLNEALLIRNFLLHLREVAPAVEIIVVDGGSRDGTALIAEPLADVVISAPPGRALQMNAGAVVARGDVLWFLHADLQVPRNSLREIEQALADRRTVGGCFRLRFPERQRIYRISDSFGNVAVEVFGFALGDHGIFCRRDVFNQLGGYRDVPILEDAEIYRTLRSRGRMVQLRDEIQCSPRAYLKYGPYRTTAVYFLILALYVLGVPISWLNRIYCWFRGSTVGILQHSSAPTPIFERHQVLKRIAG
jgi:rSAM/selenodomain-associated transferase 2